MLNRIRIIIIVGARPNFVKVAPLISKITKHKEINYLLIHTGQHYDYKMSKAFFEGLKIPAPKYNLGVGSGLHGWQTAKIIEKLEPIFIREKPNLIILVGDTNSTLSAALTATKLHIPLVHIEAGLRSFDKSMPEEINRILTDHVSDYLFTTEFSATKNLIREGINRRKIYFVGNIMIDTLLKSKNKIQKSKIFKELKLENKEYAVLTLHRPENIDRKIIFSNLIKNIHKIQKKIKIVWPIHPRAIKQLKSFNLLIETKKMDNLLLVEPLGYLEMLALDSRAKFILTDSGGLQEESTMMDIPCLTLREHTERPITVEIGTNTVVGTNKNKILKEVNKILAGQYKKGKYPKYWDGKTSQRIIKILLEKKL